MSGESRVCPTVIESAGRGTVAALLDASGTTKTATQVVETRAPDGALSYNFDALKTRRVQRKGALHADAMADATYGERGARPTTLPTNNDALKGLNTLSFTFADAQADTHRISGTKVPDVRAQGQRYNGVGVHVR